MKSPKKVILFMLLIIIGGGLVYLIYLDKKVVTDSPYHDCIKGSKKYNEVLCELRHDFGTEHFDECLSAGGQEYSFSHSGAYEPLPGAHYCEIHYYNPNFYDFPKNYKHCMQNFDKYFLPGHSTTEGTCYVRIDTKGTHKDSLETVARLQDLCVKNGGEIKYWDVIDETDCTVVFKE